MMETEKFGICQIRPLQIFLLRKQKYDCRALWKILELKRFVYILLETVFIMVSNNATHYKDTVIIQDVTRCNGWQ